MKVYLIGNRQDEITKSNFKSISDEFEKAGHSVDKSWTSKSADQDAAHFEEAYQQSMKSVKNADVVVAEVSAMSSGIGFLISTALNLKKPVLALFNESSKDDQSTTLKGSKNRLMKYNTYTQDSLTKVVQNFINETKSILDTKFILIISPEIDRYLEWAADFRRMHKAQIVREAVEKQMEKDKEWKKSQTV